MGGRFASKELFLCEGKQWTMTKNDDKYSFQWKVFKNIVSHCKIILKTDADRSFLKMLVVGALLLGCCHVIPHKIQWREMNFEQEARV